jgi:hypothetical protein
VYRFGNLLREPQMTEVDRIERAAEDADGGAHAGNSPQIRSDKTLERK